MLKNRMKNLGLNTKMESKSIEIINEEALGQIKGGKVHECPKLTVCEENYDSCPNLINCGVNH
jgi:hypothetical protein